MEDGECYSLHKKEVEVFEHGFHFGRPKGRYISFWCNICQRIRGVKL
jgi:hypothetical protein